MRRARWLAPWKDSAARPVNYYFITGVVERRLAFGQEGKEQFRTYLRMHENFSGCRVLAYCLMSLDSYGEAMGGGPRGSGKKAPAGLVRALMAHKGYR